MSSAKTVRYALGLLQDEPENRDAISDLYRALGFLDESAPIPPTEQPEETLRLLESARRGHERRRELEAAYRLLRVETSLRPDRSQALSDLIRFAEFELLDDREVVRVADAVLATDPQNAAAAGARARADERSATWSHTAASLVAEATKVDDESLRAALYARAADLVFRYARPGEPAVDAAPPSLSSVSGAKKKRKKKGASADDDAPPSTVAAPPSTVSVGDAGTYPIATWLESALRADPTHRAALHLYLRTLRLEGRWDDLSSALGQAIDSATVKEERVQYMLLRARLLHKKLDDPNQSATEYEGVLDLVPGHAEATSALVDSYTAREMWDHLVTLYEEQLRSGLVPPGEEVGLHVQVAMIRWRIQGKLEQAATAFDRVRRYEPAHPGMLQFFREYTEAHGERGRLVEVLNEAYRATTDGELRNQIGNELGALAEETETAQKAIEQYRALLRNDPANQGARDGLRRLYRQTGAMNALVDLLRGELDRTPTDAIDDRARVLREIADVYRDHTKSDSALVSVLSQLSQILPEDKDVLRELVTVFEKLGRHRDVLLAQDKLAILEEEPSVRAEIYRVVARKWLEQFTNVQNAIETYEKLREVQPKDREARDKLRELYTKRRAYRPLAELLRQEIALETEPEERRALLSELARLAAERLDQGAEAIQLYKRLLMEFPDDGDALDSLEKYAEREKDFATVADVLERRVELDGSEPGLVSLQKLGAIYTERLGDSAKAKHAWLRVLERQPGNPKALRVLRDLLVAAKDYDGLEEVYTRAGDVDALVDVFSTAAERTSDPEQKVELSFRAANLCEGRLNAPERAFRAYERVLTVRPNDLRAARALIPLYENDGRHAKAVPLYEVLVQAAATSEEKVALYTRLQEITERELKDGEAAVRYARLAYELEPTDARLSALENVAAATGGFVNFAAAIEGRVRDESTPPEERRALRKRLAELARSRGRIDDALAAYQALLEEDQDDEDVLTRLDGLLRESGKHDELRMLYDRRVARASTARKAKLLEEWAELEETAFEAKAEAARVYERLIEVVPQHGGALRALSRLYGELGDGEGALRVLERDRDERQGAERAAREVEIANVLESRLHRPARAMDAVKRALELAPDQASLVDGAMAVVERLLPRPETRAEAAALLEHYYDANESFDKQVGVLEVAIATRASKSDRMGLYAKLAHVQERRSQPEAAFEVIARAIEEYPGELEIWDTFERLARITRRVPECGERLARLLSEGALALPDAVRVELLRKAARIFEDDLGDIDRARPYLETLHARDPKDSAVFERLKQVLTTRERWDELTKLYESQIAAETDQPTRINLLEDAAIVAEEMRGDAALAARYFEQILREDPTHEDASRALEKIHREHGAHAELARILVLRLEHGGGDPIELRLELARIHLGPLEDKRKAADYLDEILTAEPLTHDARLMLEGLLQDPGLRADVAKVLERVHDARDDARSLVVMLEIRLETASPEEEEDLLRRIASLRDERLTDDAGAFEAYGRLFPRVPDDEELRERLLSIGRRLGNLVGLTRVFEEALASEALQTQKAKLAFELGQLYRELGDTERAAQSFERARSASSPQDPLLSDSLRELDTLYEAAGNAEALRGVLQASADHPDFSAERGTLFRRLGSLARDRQNDAARAVQAFERALAEDDADVQALAALTSLYESSSAFEKLADNLRRREQLAEGDAERRTMALELARVLADALGRTAEAIDQYRAVLGDFGPTDELFTRLADLYGKSERYEDLASIHEERARFTSDDGVRLAELLASGRVHQDRLSDPQSALGMYREALALDPNSPDARAAVEALTKDPTVGREAAEMLVPLYEAGTDRGQLLRMLRVQIDLAEDLDEKLQKLEQATRVAEQESAGLAFGYAAEAAGLAKDEPVLPSLLAKLEKLAAASDKHVELALVYLDLADSTLDEDRKFEALLRLGELEAGPMADAAAARRSYERALEIRPEDERALEPLQGLLERAADWAALSPLLARRADLAAAPAAQKALLRQRADLLHQKLSDNAGAIAVLEAILELGFDGVVAADLGALYMQEQRFGDLVSLYERELGEDRTDPARRAELHLLLGRVFEASLDEPERALDAYEATLALDAGSVGARDAIERFLSRTDYAERAAQALEPVYLRRRDWVKLGETLEARVRASEDPSARIELLTRLAKLKEEQEEDYLGAVEAMGRVLAEDPRDRAAWAELERLARVAGAESRLAEMWTAELAKVEGSDDEDTAALAEKTGGLLRSIGQPERALEYFKRHLAFAPESAHDSFRAIDEIYTSRGRWEERASLHRDALAYREDPDSRLQTLHVIAALEEHELRQPERAVETFRQCLDVDPEDRSALDALERLLSDLGRWADLADLLLQIAETTSDPRREARVRLELGATLHGKQGRTTEAIDQYERVLELFALDGPGAQASSALEALLPRPGDDDPDAERTTRILEILQPAYERADAWQKQIGLALVRERVAADPQDRVQILRERAKLLEQRANDRDGAFAALEEAFVLDPSSGEVREELESLAEKDARWDELSGAYEKGLEHLAADDLGRRELLLALALLHDTRRDDPRAALHAYSRLLTGDETDPDILAKVEELATLLSDWTVLVTVLRKKADAAFADDERASFYRHMGEIRRDMLEDPAGAIEAYERALEVEADSAFTVDMLIDLYVHRGERDDAARLAALYKQRIELAEAGRATTDSDDLPALDASVFELLLAAAAVYETSLDDRKEAIELYVRADALRPRQPAVLARLEVLYAAEHMTPELLDNLRAQRETAADAETKRALLVRIAGIHEAESDYPDAIAAYRTALEERFDAELAARLFAIADVHADFRGDVASFLEAPLRAHEQHADLVRALRWRAEAEVDLEPKVAAVFAVADAEEQGLGDAGAAFRTLAALVPEAPAHDELHERLTRLAAVLGKDAHQTHADLIAKENENQFEAEVGKVLSQREARIAELELNDPARAAKALRRALEQGGDDERILGELARLYRALGQKADVAEVLERRAELVDDPALMADISAELGDLFTEDDPGRALASYRAALERVARHDASRKGIERLLDHGDLFDDAFETLEALYRDAGDLDALVALHDRRIRRATDKEARIAARLALADVMANDPPRAQKILEDALAEDPTDASVQSALEAVVFKTGNVRSSLDAMVRALETNETLTAEVRADAWKRVGQRLRTDASDDAAAERAFERATQLAPDDRAALDSLIDLRRAPGREADLFEVLRLRARLGADQSAKEADYREAFGLVAANPETAESVLREALGSNESWLFAIDELATLKADVREGAELLLRRAELSQGDEARAYRLRAAESFERHGERPRAISLYEELVADAPLEGVAPERLRAAYEADGNVKALAKLIESQIDAADSAEVRSTLRVELAKLSLEKLQDADAAAGLLRLVLEEAPRHAEALPLLVSVYEQLGSHDELARLLEAELVHVRDGGDCAAELPLRMRLAGLYEAQLDDKARALGAYTEAMDLALAGEADPTLLAEALHAAARLGEEQRAWDVTERALRAIVERSAPEQLSDNAQRLAAIRKQQGDTQGAIDAFRIALSAAPDLDDARRELTTLLRGAERWEELAQALVDEAEHVRTKAGAAIPATGSVPPRAGPVVDVLALYTEAADIHLHKRGVAADAATVLERASSAVPDSREVLLQLCDAYVASGRERDATAVLERIIASFGGKRTKELALYHHRLGKALVGLGERERALQEYDLAFKIDPGNVGVLRDLGVLALDSGDLERAQKTFRALLIQKLDPGVGLTKGEVFEYLGLIAEKQGDKTKAVEMYKRAIDNDPGRTKAKENLAALK